ncbi:Glycosylphosphatidylinositol anchor biosynthesis protein 11 [Rhodotorula toruloides]|nr:Glycosylphosphatidylinositol anchor biosynthesis protein 11 [Rhodotorula toruloides]
MNAVLSSRNPRRDWLALRNSRLSRFLALGRLAKTHPDGDPFAERDAEAARSSWLGRLESKALAENAAESSSVASSPAPANRKNGSAPPKPALPKRESSGGTGKARQSLGFDSKGNEILVVDSDSEEDEDYEGGGAAAAADEDEASGSDEGEGSGSDEGEEGSEAGEGDETPKVGATENEEDDEDSEEDDSDDDSSSTTSERHEGGEDVEMADGGAAKAKSPKKAREGDDTGGDAEMKDGEGKEGAEGEPKEKKKRRRRQQRTPTPPPLAPKEPRPTIRLEIALPPRKDDVAPEFNIVQLAKDAGFIKDEPKKEGGDDDEGSESDGQGGRRKKGKEKADDKGTPGAAEAGEAGENGPPKKRRKRGPNAVLGRFGGYDTNDPFVDDSEVALYEPRFYARPKREGYFVCAGPVEVAPRRGRVKGSKNKPKLDENGNPVPVATTSRRKSTHKVVVGADGKPVHDADASAGPSESGASVPPFGAAAQPPKKVRKKEYDDDFFAEMPKIFPYNLFTMKKLIKREVFHKRILDMTTQQDELLSVIQDGIDQSYDAQRLEFERKRAEWEKQQAEGGGSAATNLLRRTPEPTPGTPGFGGSPAITTPLIAVAECTEGSPAPGKDDDDEKGQAEPKWRFRFNEQMREALYKVSELEDKKSELISEKQSLEKATTREVNREKPHSVKNARKQLYQRIINLWPQDMMTSNQISREISNYKLKLKRLDRSQLLAILTMAARKKVSAAATPSQIASTSSASGKAPPTPSPSSSHPRDPLPFAHFLPRLPLQLVAVLFSCVTSSSVTLPDVSIPAPTRFVASLIRDPLSTLPLLCGLLAIIQGWFGYWARSCRLEAEKANKDVGAKADTQVTTRTESKSFRGSLGKLWDNALKGEAPHQRLFKKRADGQSAFASIDTRFVPQAVMITLGATLTLHGAIVLLGAPLTSNVTHTFLLALLLAVLAVLPLSIALPPVATTNGRFAWLRLVSSLSPSDNLELVLIAPAVGTLVGAWTGAFPIPLDWDRPWQKWPVTPTVGALAGHAIGSLVGFAVVAWRKTLEAAVDVLQEAKENEGMQRKTGGMKETRKIK